MSNIDSADFHRVLPEHFTNGLVLELREIIQERKCSDKNLLNILFKILPATSSETSLHRETLRSEVFCLRQRKRKQRKALKPILNL